VFTPLSPVLQTKVSGQQGMWMYQKGVYPSSIRNNFVGEPESEILRDRVAVPDNNAFVTLWVSIMLLEAARVKNGPVPAVEQLHLALDAINGYHDNNSPAGDGTMVFWPQSYNSSVQQWYCDPVNVEKVGQDMESMYNFIHTVLDDVHLEEVWKKLFKQQQGIL
jgi:hypothetical protein